MVRIVLYRDTADEWRWRAQADNDEIVSEGESHTRWEDARRAATGVIPGVRVFREDVTDDGNGVTLTEVTE